MYRWFFFLFLTACVSQQAADPQQLYNHTWLSFTGDAKYRLNIAKSGQLSGSDGCNRIFGQVSVGKRLDFSKVAATKMACQHAHDRAFWEAIQKHDSWRIRNDELQLLLGKKVILRLQKEQAAAEQWSNEAEE